MRGAILALVATAVVATGALIHFDALVLGGAAIAIVAFHVTMADFVRDEQEQRDEVARIVERARREERGR